jgi:lipid-A-disaccharide synthase
VKLVYYISPQVWAWNRGRIPRMARELDRMLCIFPFEQDLYEKSGLPTNFVGHPMALHTTPADETARDPNLLALLPGSREREVRKIFPVMLAAAQRVRRDRPATRFAAAAPSEKLQEIMSAMASAAGVTCEIGLRQARGLMENAAAGLVASGTATLEATLLGLPYALVYRTAWLTYIAARLVIKVPYLGMANLLAGRPIVKEFIQNEATPEALAAEAIRLLDDPAARAMMRADFAVVRDQLTSPTATPPALALREALETAVV